MYHVHCNYGFHVNFKHIFYQTLCVFSQMKDRKHIEHNFHSVPGVMPQGWNLGVLMWAKNFSVGISDGAPSTSVLVDFVIVTGCMDFKCKLPH